MRGFLKKNQAITLVSLVVTIIILIILAGVSINLILGKNGIITIAKQAKENTELAKIEEETALNELYMQIEAEGGTSGDISYDAITKLVEFKREIASAISDMGVTTLEDADATTMASNIRSISGASSADKISYDNTNSGLTSTNVQGAIDEVNNNLMNIGKFEQIGQITGSNTITIDTEKYSEISCLIYLYSYGNLSSNLISELDYGSVSVLNVNETYGKCCFILNYTDKTLSIASAITNGADVKANSSITVYGKK